jgi:hypothetical protein
MIGYNLPLTKLKVFYPGQMGVPGDSVPRGIRHFPDALAFYVDPGHGDTSDNNDGTDPEAPLTTISQGVANCVTGRGDWVVVSPANYNPTAAITLDKKDITVIAMPAGGNPRQPDNRVAIWPAATYTTGPTFIIEEPCTLSGFEIAARNVVHGGTPATASAAVAIDGNGGGENGFSVFIHNCNFPDWFGAAYGIWFWAGSDCRVQDCDFRDWDAAIAFRGSPLNNPTFNVIQDCIFWNCTNGIEHLPVTHQDFIYYRNIFLDYTDAIDFNNQGGNGLICDNFYETATDAATYDIAVAAAQVLGYNFSGNHYSE